MEVPSVTNELDEKDKVCKSLPDKFDSAFSLEETASDLSMVKHNANLDGEILYGRQIFPSVEAHPSKGEIKCESSSKPIIDNVKDKTCYAHRKIPNASILKKVTSTGNKSSIDGKKMVWRVAGSNKTSDGTTLLKVEATSAASSANVDGDKRVPCSTRSNETPNVTKLSEVKENDFMVTSNASQESLISRDASLDFSETSSLTSNTSSTPMKVKVTSVGYSSSVRGGNLVWRIAGSNGTSNVTKLSKVKGNDFSVCSNASEGPLISRDADLDSSKKSLSASKASSAPLKVQTTTLARNSSVHGENRVWRIVGSKEIPKVTKLTKVKGNDFPNASQGPLISRNAYLDFSETSSSTSNASSDDDIETFLFEMLGRGFQLERITIREVLGNCGYDMKKSVETLLELSAVQFDRRNHLSEGRHLHSNRKSFLSENQKQNRKSVESNGSRTNFVPSRQPKLGLLTAPFDTPEQPDLTVSAHLPKTFASSTMEVVTYGDNTENFDDMKDDAEEGSYYNLRKAVKEHRETMKQYYKSAADAFATGDRDRAVSLLEKGQVFYSKAREADAESVSKIFETSTTGSGDGNVEEVSLDLQDHDAKEAISLVKIHLRSLSGIPSVQDLKINIGNGDRFVEKRKRLILKLLKKEGIKWIEDEKSGAIFVRLDEINPKNLSFGKPLLH